MVNFATGKEGLKYYTGLIALITRGECEDETNQGDKNVFSRVENEF